jgi:hypothetical protein
MCGVNFAQAQCVILSPMRHHAFYATGSPESVVNALKREGFPDEAITTLSYTLLSVDDARKVADLASRKGGRSALIIKVERLFHEAQNGLLKTFEEPPEGLTLVLLVPSAGTIIPTLRSRLLPLSKEAGIGQQAAAYLAAGKEERGKMIEKLVNRAKSDAVEEKNLARREALALVEGITVALYPKRTDPAVRSLLSDLDHFTPLLNDRSAPLKPILEHLNLLVP